MDWYPTQPIATLPERIQSYFQQEAELLHNELFTNKLEVILMPAPAPHFDSHKIRVAICHNPPWYSAFYHAYDYFRRDRSLRALYSIVEKKDRQSNGNSYKYQRIYRGFIFQRLIGEYNEQGYWYPANLEVCRYFGLGENVK